MAEARAVSGLGGLTRGLLPCPFCGGKEREPHAGQQPGLHLIEHTDDCYIGRMCRDGVLRLTGEYAEAWNCRPAIPRDIPREGEEKDADRYRWLRTRINWEDTTRVYGELSTKQREWTHIDMRLQRPASEHIDEYIDGQLDTAMSQERGE